MAPALQQLSQINPGVLQVGTVGAMVYGVLSCFFGYKIFKFALGIIGLILGAIAGARLAAFFTPESMLILVAALVGGVLGAGLLLRLFILGLFVMGALVGGLIAGTVSAALGLQGEVSLIVTVILVLGGGILAVSFQKLMIIISTAFSGAWSLVTGAAFFLFGVSPLLLARNPAALKGTQLVIVTAAWLVLGVMGFMVQRRTRRPS